MPSCVIQTAKASAEVPCEGIVFPSGFWVVKVSAHQLSDLHYNSVTRVLKSNYLLEIVAGTAKSVRNFF